MAAKIRFTTEKYMVQYKGIITGSIMMMKWDKERKGGIADAGEL